MNARIFLLAAIVVLTIVGALAFELPGSSQSLPPVHPPPADLTSPRAPHSKPAATPVANFVTPPGPAPEGMVWIPGGRDVMGDDQGTPDERPAHSVTIDGFWMDRTEVTNAQFKKFVMRPITSRSPNARPSARTSEAWSPT